MFGVNSVKKTYNLDKNTFYLLEINILQADLGLP